MEINIRFAPPLGDDDSLNTLQKRQRVAAVVTTKRPKIHQHDATPQTFYRKWLRKGLWLARSTDSQTRSELTPHTLRAARSRNMPKLQNELGISKFFEENKKNTSTVVVLGEKNKISFKTTHNYDRKAYMRAFDDAIKMNSMMMKN